MLAIHPNARTTPAVRAEIARSGEPTGVLAERYGVSAETVRKWRPRGAAECQDRSSRPHRLPWKASEEERAVVRELRRATGFPLDELTFVVALVGFRGGRTQGAARQVERLKVGPPASAGAAHVLAELGELVVADR